MTGEPFIPQYITVHLGPPDSSAANVTLPFFDYIKNVASSEIRLNPTKISSWLLTAYRTPATSAR